LAISWLLFFRSHFLGGRRHSCKYGAFNNVSRRGLREVIPSNVGRGLLERIHWFKDGFNDYMWEEGLSLREALQAIIGMPVGLVEE
jgi:hypothetical protein